MSTGKGPSRVTDGPYANWGVDDEQAQVVVAANGTLKIGQPMCLDVTQFGPDNNVPNNGASLPLAERLVATTSANAGPCFGVMTGMTTGLPKGWTYGLVAGVPTWTNSSGASTVVTVTVRQLGWAYVWSGTAAIGQTGGNSILVGSTLITTTAQAFAIQGSATIGSTVGVALATAINSTQTGRTALGVVGSAPGAPEGPGVISVMPQTIVGLVPNTIVLIDSLATGVQEAVSVGSISYPTFSVAATNAHAAGFRITGPATNPAKNAVLISTPGAGVTIAGLVATYVNIQA